jgi:ferredoxin
MEQKVKAEIDLELCQGHGQCQEAAPSVFEVRDDGYAYLLADTIPVNAEAGVRDAASRCPTDAIRITD